MKRFSLIACLAFALSVTACARTPSQPLVAPTYFAEDNPATLREWGMVQEFDGQLVLGPRVTPYDLNTPLFTDYAQKLRTIWMPEGAAATYNADDTFDFPVGAVITKTFFYETTSGGRVLQVADRSRIYDGEALDLRHVRMIETRVLVHRPQGWVALTYLWNEDQTEARLLRVGAIVPLELVREDGEREAFSYVVPNVTQCASCHAPNIETRTISPIGPKARHLNRDYAYDSGSENQLAHLTAMGYLQGLTDPSTAPANAVWTDTTASLDARARAYLDINCAHCHNEHGPADTSGLYLNAGAPLGGNFGVCKLPVAAGSGTGNRRFDIVPGHAESSVIPYRIASEDPAVMMPEIGRSTSHAEGVALISAWINAMEGSCR
jgi:uncharacterized repeat protein (TIGR03806 family)